MNNFINIYGNTTGLQYAGRSNRHIRYAIKQTPFNIYKPLNVVDIVNEGIANGSIDTGSGSDSNPSGPTDPVSPSIGDVWFNTTDDTLYVQTTSGKQEIDIDVTNDATTYTSNVFTIVNSYIVTTGLTNIIDYSIYQNNDNVTDSFETEISGGDIMILSNVTVPNLHVRAVGS